MVTRHIVLAGTALRLTLPDEDLATRVDERYEGFLVTETGARGALELDFEVDPDARPTGFHPVWVNNPQICASGDLSRARLEGEGFRGEIDWEQGRGTARIPDSLAHLDLVVRVALGVTLLRTGDTLLHAAAVLRDHWGLVFCGPSGAGKSTLADICREGGLEVLADEMVALRRQGAGLRIHGTPFWRGSLATGPAAAIFLLRQADQAQVERISAERALPEMLSAGGAPLDLPAVQEAFFAALAGLLRRVPAYRLSFAPNAGFWPSIDRLPEFAFFRPRPRRLHPLTAAPNSTADKPPSSSTGNPQ